MNRGSQLSIIAQRALLYEATCHPKPGLVDPVSAGAHNDMTIFTFIDSSCSMQMEFEEMYQFGYQFTGNHLKALFQGIRPIGLKAETKMLAATNSVNTHKGAIFSLGILLAAAGYLDKHAEWALTDLYDTVSQMTSHLLEDFETLSIKDPTDLTNGENLYVRHGLLGVRGEVSQAFPIVRQKALPLLRTYQTITNEHLLNVLMIIASENEDSNLIKRAGSVDVLNEIKAWSSTFFAKGGAETPEGMTYLQELNQQFIERNLSFGGSADLLIITVFLFLLENELVI